MTGVRLSDPGGASGRVSPRNHKEDWEGGHVYFTALRVCQGQREFKFDLVEEQHRIL